MPKTIQIPLTRGKVAIVDECDAHLATAKWYCAHTRGIFYAQRTIKANGKKWTLHLHREVLGLTDRAMEVDHINGDGLDCRRSNLRVVRHADNLRNRGPTRVNTTGFKGVSWDDERRLFYAQMSFMGKRIHLGRYRTAEEASLAFAYCAKALHGEFFRLHYDPATAATRSSWTDPRRSLP